MRVHKENVIKDTPLKFVPRFLRIHKARTGRHWVWAEHINTECEIMLIKKGKERNCVDNKEFIASEGDLYFVQPGQLHYEEIMSTHLDYYLLRFDLLDGQGTSSGFIPDGYSRKQCIRNMGKKINCFFEEIFELAWSDDPAKESQTEAVILKLVNIIRREFMHGEHSNKQDRFTQPRPTFIENAVEFIKSDLTVNLSVADLADFCCVSPSHLTHVFKDVIGVSPLKYHQQLRMEKAKRLLLDDSLCVYQVANRLGYEDAYYFSRLFKKVTGHSPLKFRNHIRSIHF